MHHADWISGDPQIFLTRGDDHSELRKKRREYCLPLLQVPEMEGYLTLLGMIPCSCSRIAICGVVSCRGPVDGSGWDLGLHFANDIGAHPKTHLPDSEGDDTVHSYKNTKTRGSQGAERTEDSSSFFLIFTSFRLGLLFSHWTSPP